MAPAGPDCPVLTFEPRGTLSCEVPEANSPLAFLDLALLTCGFTAFSIGSGVGNGAGGAGGAISLSTGAGTGGAGGALSLLIGSGNTGT